MNQEQKKPKNYWELYNQTYAPKFQEIDITLKAEPTSITVDKVCRLLSLSTKEVEGIIAKNKITALNPRTFIEIMRNGSSEICRLFKRQISCGVWDNYTPWQISYIYDIDIDIVLSAVSPKEKSLDSEELKLVLSKIPV